MTLREKQIYWLAGLVEGEGCFSVMRTKRSNPKICTPILTVTTTDIDVAHRLSLLLRDPNPIRATQKQCSHHKQAYHVTIRGSLAVSWMFILYPLLSKRRRKRIKEVVAAWEESPGPFAGRPGEENPMAKLTKKQVRWVRKAAACGLWTQREIARRFGVSQSLISLVKSGYRWT